MGGPKDANPVGLPDPGAVCTCYLHELLEALPSSDHVHYVTTNLNNKLLWYHYPRPKFWPEGMATEVVVVIKSNPWNTLMELYHLPHRVQGDAP